MPKKEIRHILCAVRGVPQSRDTVSYAIQFSLEHHSRLTFVHVNDARFMASASPTLTSLATVYKQMRDMSEFALLVLCDRAKRRGIEVVDYQILEGRFLVQIQRLVYELNPDILVVGKPVAADPGSPIIQMNKFEEIMDEIQQKTQTYVHPVEFSVEE